MAVSVRQDVGGWCSRLCVCVVCVCARTPQEKLVTELTSRFSLIGCWGSCSYLLLVCFFFPAVSCTALARENTNQIREPCSRVCAYCLSSVLNKQEIISSIHCCCVCNGCLYRQINKKEKGSGDSSSVINHQLPKLTSFARLFLGHGEPTCLQQPHLHHIC